MTVRAVVFDLGHTLWDIGPHAGALERAYDELRVQLARRSSATVPDARALQRAVYDALVESSDTYFANSASNIARLEQPPSYRWLDAGCGKLGLHFDDETLRELAPPLFATEIENLICHEGTIEALASLHDEGYALGCVTNTLANESSIRAMLRKYDVERLMQSVVVSAEAGYRKPHPSLFRAALGDLSVEATEAVFVGDSPWHDIAGAQAVGMRAIMTTQYVTRPPMDGVTPDAIISHTRELQEVLGRL